MSTQYAKQLIGTLVEQHRSRARVFERFGIDYFFEGSRSVAEVCSVVGADLNTVCHDLEQCDASDTHCESNEWLKARLTDLVDQIIERHHSYLREELPWLKDLLDLLVRRYGKQHPEMNDLREVLSDVQYNMHAHMIKEERTVFSMVRQLEQAHNTGRKPPEFAPTAIRDSVRVLEAEHHTALDALKRIRELARDFALPTDTNDVYRALLIGLEDLEADLHLHLHKESNILFPRAIELEKQMRGSAA
jgi:regulator of cell morphogenesis and NO signaling